MEMGKMIVRRATLGDMPSITTIANWAVLNTSAIFRTEPETSDVWAQRWRADEDRYPWLVAEVNGAVAGFARASVFGGRCGLASTVEVSVYVAPEHHGTGVGRALYDRLIPLLRAQGYRTAVAEIVLPNPASERLHEACGFRRVGRLEQVGWKFGKWHDIGTWQLELGETEAPPVPIKPVHEVIASGERGALAGQCSVVAQVTGADRVRASVARTYAAALEVPATESAATPEPKGFVVKSAGYRSEDLEGLPASAVVNAFGCGNPLAFSEVREGEVVLDLGSGAGIDLLIAAKRVGPSGRVIGVDMTPEMIAKAREAIAAAGLAQVEVRQGLIEDLPVSSGSVDWVISNCVINLSPEKEKVFAEIARVLKPGGRMLVSDIVAQDLPADVLQSMELYCSCVAGAISEEAYLAGLRRAGLVDVEVRERIVYDADQLAGLIPSEQKVLESAGCCGSGASGQKLPERGGCCGIGAKDLQGLLPDLAERCVGRVWSAKIYARKPE
ncbi:MAG: arsenite methyltransferase [Planctomycetota bacterium]